MNSCLKFKVYTDAAPPSFYHYQLVILHNFFQKTCPDISKGKNFLFRKLVVFYSTFDVKSLFQKTCLMHRLQKRVVFSVHARASYSLEKWHTQHRPKAWYSTTQNKFSTTHYGLKEIMQTFVSHSIHSR